jgi:transcriptional regulator of arginine metabolism
MPVHDEQWEDRQKTIRQVLTRRVVRTQGQLTEILREHGFEVTQSSVSRDLADLRAVKRNGRYVAPGSDGIGAPVTELREIASSIREFHPAGSSLLVVRTPPGRATLVAMALDRAGWPEMAGCIAGDDTVFVATQGRSQQAVLSMLLGRLVKESINA